MAKYQKEYSLEQLQNKILYYINYRIRSQNEVVKKLQILHASAENTKLIIDELINIGLINDEKFIIFFIQDYLEIKKYGITKVKNELYRKGFESWLIQDSLQRYLKEEEYNPIEGAYQLLEQKYRFRPILPDSHKIIAFLARRGFEYNIAIKAIKKFELENDAKNV